MTEVDTDLVQVRVDVAEMRGMLSQALSDHGQRISNIEVDNRVLHGRLSDKGRILATHDEKIIGVERAVNALENNRIGMPAKVGIFVAMATGIIGTSLAMYNSLRFGG